MIATENAPITLTPNSAGQPAYQWTFQSANISTSTSENPTITWSNIGSFQVTLSVTDSEGCIGNDTALITVISCTPATYQFSNCNSTGINGPSQANCNNAYSSGNLNGQVTVISGIQNWTVPQTGTYRIEAAGAKGGSTNSSFPGGGGAIIRGEVFLTAGQTLKILVGQEGSVGLTSSWGHGGGGRTYVTLTDNTPLIIAGGGGYSGGGGGATNSPTSYGGGGGGGSFVAAGSTNVGTSSGQYDNSSQFEGNPISNIGQFRNGHGYVTISIVCP